MNLRKLLLIHAVVTLAAGIVLSAAPGAIPRTVGIHLGSDAYLLSYLLGAAEIELAFLSWTARWLQEIQALRLVAQTFIVFHAVMAAAEAVTFAQGVEAKI